MTENVEHTPDYRSDIEGAVFAVEQAMRVEQEEVHEESAEHHIELIKASSSMLAFVREQEALDGTQQIV